MATEDEMPRAKAKRFGPIPQHGIRAQISLRIPAATLRAYTREARRRGISRAALMIDVLMAAEWKFGK